jgi:hypothetical protein
MNMDNLNKWLTLVANIGVVAGIVFLAMELQQNTESLENEQRLAVSQAYQQRSDSVRNMLIDFATGDLNEILVELQEHGWPENRDAFAEIDPAQRQDFIMLNYSRWHYFDNVHYQYQQGFIDEEYYNSEFVSAVRLFGEQWEALGRPGSQRPSFVAEVERILYGNN